MIRVNELVLIRENGVELLGHVIEVDGAHVTIRTPDGQTYPRSVWRVKRAEYGRAA